VVNVDIVLPARGRRAQQEQSKRNTKGAAQQSFRLLPLEPVSRDSLLFSPAPLAALDVSILEFFSL
jgi:hypothetical protein